MGKGNCFEDGQEPLVVEVGTVVLVVVHTAAVAVVVVFVVAGAFGGLGIVVLVGFEMG